jgi:hypothetical protein
MTFYLSCRPLRYRREMISPKECLKNNFAGIKYAWRCLGWNTKQDGRWLYEIELDDAYSPAEAAELQQIFVEGLAAFAAHLKTPESAKELAEKVTGLAWSVKDERIEAPTAKES